MSMTNAGYTDLPLFEADSDANGWKRPPFAETIRQGRLPWAMACPFPDPSNHDIRACDEITAKTLRILEEYIDPVEVDRTGDLPEETLLALASVGSFGMLIPREYGGLGLSHAMFQRALGRIAGFSNAVAAIFVAHQCLGAVQPLLLFGSSDQKRRHLPRLAQGAISAFAYTEPGMGLDLATMRMTADPLPDGSGYRLNGEKMWCVNGPLAEYVVVFAVIPASRQVTAFLIESDTPGLEVVHHCSFMGLRGLSCGMLRFHGLEASAENVIGLVGQGAEIALACQNVGRLAMVALAAANGRMAARYAQDWFQARAKSSQPTSEHSLAARMLTDLESDAFALEAVSHLTVHMLDAPDGDIRIEAALAKLFASSTIWRVCDTLMQLRGGKGYETVESLERRGESPVPAERMLRDVRASRLILGPDEMIGPFAMIQAINGHAQSLTPAMSGTTGWPVRWNLVRRYAMWYARQWMPATLPQAPGQLNEANRSHLNFTARACQTFARSLFHLYIKSPKRYQERERQLFNLAEAGAQLSAMIATLGYAAHLAAKHPQRAAEAEALADHFCARARNSFHAAIKRAKNTPPPTLAPIMAAALSGSMRWLYESDDTAASPTAPADLDAADASEGELLDQAMDDVLPDKTKPGP